MSTSSQKLIPQLLSLLTVRQRWQALVLLVALVLRAAVQLLGVASIAPFMGVVADPGIVQSNRWLHRVYEFGSFSSSLEFLTAIGIGAIILLASSNALSALASWGLLRFVWNVHHTLCTRLFSDYLHRPYSFFVQRNTASMHQNLLSEVQISVTGVLVPVLNTFAQSLVILALVGMLVVVDPVLALGVVGILGGAYAVVFFLVRRRQSELGKLRLRAHRERYKIAGEAFGGIKDVKILQREPSFLAQFRGPSLDFSRANSTNATVAQLPRYLLETIAFGGILTIVLYYLRSGDGIGQFLPVISLYAFAGYRLMPALQTLFASLAGMRYQRAALDSLTEDLSSRSTDEQKQAPQVPTVPFEATIRFDEVSFKYPNSENQALTKVSLEIEKNRTIGLVGVSGGGKTTLVDLLLGLYPPTDGQITVDGIPLDSTTVPSWRNQVGYVPQTIFLSDDSVTNNIAFGVSPKDINIDAVHRAARTAHLDSFVSELPDQYDTHVGEQGVRLSGGQRQRIGIARALYHDPAVLVLDEATSALDGKTESAVMEAIQSLSGRKTIILIAHRLTTVQECDRIYLLDGGEVSHCGSYQSMKSESKLFQAMAKSPV